MKAYPFLFSLLFIACTAGAQQPSLQSSLTQAATTFLDSLSGSQRQEAQLSFDDPERLRWGNEPYNMHPRKGLRLDEMSDGQKKSLHVLLQQVLSEQGYLKAVNVIRLDEWLKHHYYKPPAAQYYGEGLYWITFFGTPSAAKTWGWRFEGHHLSLSVTVSPDHVSVTPFFLGSHPAVVPDGPYAGTENLFAETGLAWKLMDSFSAVQRQQAVVSPQEPPGADILTRTGDEPHMKQVSGIPVSAMNQGQQQLVQALLEAYVKNLTPALANRYLREIRSKEWPRLYFAWMGPVRRGQPVYYRLQSSGGFIIEYCERLHDTNHIHTLWRMLPEDFGGAR